MKDIRIVKIHKDLDERMIESCAAIVTEAFEKEGVSSYMYDFSKKNTKKNYYNQTVNTIKSHLASDNLFLLALKERDVVGLAVLNKNLKLPVMERVKSLRFMIPTILPVLTAINFRKAFSARKAFKSSHKLADNYYTLFAIAVHPDYHGQGIGKMLLKRINEIVDSTSGVSGVYLFTADEKNKELYEKFNYKTIEETSGGGLKVFHMFNNIS